MISLFSFLLLTGTMVMYMLTVYTGDWLRAGTMHHIYAQLHGNAGSTQIQCLNGCTSLSRGSVGQSLDIICHIG